MKVRTWTYSQGRARQVYVWAKRWTLSVALIRKAASRETQVREENA